MSRLVFPLFTLAIASYLAAEQYFGNYRPLGSYFIYGLAIPLIIFALSQILMDLRALRAENIHNAAPEGVKGKDRLQDRLRVLIFLAVTITTYLALPYVGYIVSFGVFLITGFLLLGVRRPVVLVPLTAGTLVFIHLVFVEYLQTRLPLGFMRALF